MNGILLFLALYQNKFNTINFIVEKVEFAQFPSHFGRRNSQQGKIVEGEKKEQLGQWRASR